MTTLRPYQQQAAQAAINFIKKSKAPFLLEAATGAGKSHIIAYLADWARGHSDNVRVLCLAPSKELTEQNYEKYLATGNPASIYSASTGRKELRHQVIFGMEKSVLNSIDKFPKISFIVVDECHALTNTLKELIARFRARNQKLRVMGLTATPYRTGEGYIYRINENGNPAYPIKNEPYFSQLIYKITTRELLEMGYLTPVEIGAPSELHYDAIELKPNRLGKFSKGDIEQAFEGKGRLTSSIIADVVSLSRDRKGVLLFAASIQHAQEILESLPPHNSALVTGKTKKAERERIIKSFKAQKIKYLVNVAILTTGFDAPHIDVIAILRATESPGLLQQIIGRGLRLAPEKANCLILDYAENLERHCPLGDIFDPELKVIEAREGSENLEVKCPLCSAVNLFAARPNEFGAELSDEGYFVDLLGNPILNEYETPIPSHYGRRCYGYDPIKQKRCSYRWSGKDCPECEHHNDIAARVCESCGFELVDPNEKLKLEFAKMKADPYITTTDKVLAWQCRYHKSQAGNDTLRIDYTTGFRTFAVWYLPKQQRLWNDLSLAVFGKMCPSVKTFLEYYKRGNMPQTITVKRDRGSKFYTVYGHNREETIGLQNLR